MGKELHRFFLKNRNKGIPNLMLYLCLANVMLYLYTFFTKDMNVYFALCFSSGAILHGGQIWRCVTWILTYGVEGYIGGGTIGLLYIVFYVLFNRWLGSVLENIWGTFRLNLYYFGGALLTVVAALIVDLATGNGALVTAYYLNISLMLAVATVIPEERILLFGIFPLKLRWLALLDLALIFMEIVSQLAPYSGMDLWLVFLTVGTAPFISLLNYVLNFGKDVARLLPIKATMQQKKRQRDFQKGATPNPNWANNYRSKTGERPYRHKCTVCGRTDTDNPGLEFRYCSRCKGYFCYCIDHINQHTHIE